MELEEMDPQCTRLIHQILPTAQAEDDPAVMDRLYSSPTAGREPDFEDDWKEYVHPDLRHIFQNAQQIVQADLKGLAHDLVAGFASLQIPVKNLEAWVHTLNQARLAIATRYDFTDEDMEKPHSLGSDARSRALFQVHFYGFLQECFLQQLDTNG